MGAGGGQGDPAGAEGFEDAAQSAGDSVEMPGAAHHQDHLHCHHLDHAYRGEISEGYEGVLICAWLVGRNEVLLTPGLRCLPSPGLPDELPLHGLVDVRAALPEAPPPRIQHLHSVGLCHDCL